MLEGEVIRVVGKAAVRGAGHWIMRTFICNRGYWYGMANLCWDDKTPFRPNTNHNYNRLMR